MTLAWLSLIALVVVMVASCFTTLNVGVLALALAWIVGVYLGSMGLGERGAVPGRSGWCHRDRISCR